MTVVATDTHNMPPAMTARSDEGLALRLQGIKKHFRRRDGTLVPAVDDVELSVNPGEFVVLLGPSGCGKTTLLRCVAGLESPDEGEIAIHGAPHYSSANTLDSAPERRKLGMVFQSYALWPHMKVFSNVAYPLRVRKLGRAEIRTRVHEVLASVGIAELAEQYPGQLSGGQQQRVALARALVSSDGLLLFDEPLSNVDAKVREQLRYEIRRMQQQIGFAAIYVTHDQEEAMDLADRIAVLNDGKIRQIGSPQEIYDTPADRYVAKFIGAANEIVGRISAISEDGTGTVETEAGPIFGILGQEGLAQGDEVSVIVRPEKCQLVQGSQPDNGNDWQAERVATTFMGPTRRIIVRAPGWGEVQVHFSSSEMAQMEDGNLILRVPPECARIYLR